MHRRNCGAFLKITSKARNLVNAEVKAIDSLHIDPLHYNLAFSLAREAVHGRPGEDHDVANSDKAMAHPELVELLNLEVGDSWAPHPH